MGIFTSARNPLPILADQLDRQIMSVIEVKRSSTEEIDVEETEIETFEFKQLSKDIAKVKIASKEFDPKEFPSRVSLLALSNTYGYFVAASTEGFIFSTTKNLRSAFIDATGPQSAKRSERPHIQQTVHVKIKDGKIRCLRLSFDQLTICVAVSNAANAGGGRLLLYDAAALSRACKDVGPYQEISLDSDIVEIRPNTGDKPNIIAVLLITGSVKIIGFESNSSKVISEIKGDVSSICWSPKGKQIACGTYSGKIIQYTQDAIAKVIYPPPPKLPENQSMKVLNLFWLETFLFVVAYYPVVQDENAEAISYVIQRESDRAKYHKIPALCLPVFATERGPNFYIEVFRGWDSKSPFILVCANTQSSEIELAAFNNNRWTKWFIEIETSRASLPISDLPNNDEDTHIVGMTLDFTDTDEWMIKLDEDSTSSVPPAPILYILNDEDDVIAYRCFNREAFVENVSYSQMAKVQQLPEVGPSNKKVEQGEYSSVVQHDYKIDKTNQPTLPPETPKAQVIPPPQIRHVEQKKSSPYYEPAMGLAHSIDVILKKQEITQRHFKDRKRAAADRFSRPEYASAEDLNCYDLRKIEKLQDKFKHQLEILDANSKHLKQEVAKIRTSVYKGRTTSEMIELFREAMERPATGRLGIIQARVKGQLEKSVRVLGENIQLLETQLSALKKQISERKGKKILTPQPLEFVDRSIRNISKTISVNSCAIDRLIEEMEQLAISSNSAKPTSSSVTHHKLRGKKREMSTPDNIYFPNSAAASVAAFVTREYKSDKLRNVFETQRIQPVLTKINREIFETRTSSGVHISPIRTPPKRTLTQQQRTSSARPRTRYDQRRNVGLSWNKKMEEFIKKDAQILNEEEAEDSEEFYYEDEEEEEEELTEEEVSEGVEEDVVKVLEEEVSEVVKERVEAVERVEEEVVKVVEEKVVGLVEEEVVEEVEEEVVEEVEEEVVKEVVKEVVEEAVGEAVGLGEEEAVEEVVKEVVEEAVGEAVEEVVKEVVKEVVEEAVGEAVGLVEEEAVEEVVEEAVEGIGFDEEGGKSNTEMRVKIGVGSIELEEKVEYVIDEKGRETEAREEDGEEKDKEERQQQERSESEEVEVEERIRLDEEKGKSNSEIGLEIGLSGIELEEKVDYITDEKAQSTISQLTFGQSSFGQSSFGQSSFGQSTFGQSAISQPTFGQSTMSQPTFGQSSFGQSTFGQSAISQPTFGQSTVSQPTFGQSTTAPPTFGQSTITQPTFGQSTTTQPAFGQSAVGQPTFGQSAFSQPTFGQSAFSQPTFGQSAFGQPTFGQPAFGQHGFGQPVFGQHGFGQNPTLAAQSLKAPATGGFARYTSNSKLGGFGAPSTPSDNTANAPQDSRFTQYR
ncbi:6146_t:CDS:10 [Paraglomus occultum]|uniref:6146_t:CDS:1 n=1 Tax=Paraglomus occultum TaxID=144539 RepID=A0A9N9FZD8_9GLOM|nr:6146_t:CDS:10 [Paraglomus occultum]